MPEKIEDAEKLALIYVKTGLSREKIAAKLEKFGEADKARALNAIDAYYAEKSTREREIAFKVKIFFIFCLMVFAISYYTLFIHAASYSSSCLGDGHISISGDPLQRFSIISALGMIERQGCDYILFVYENTPSIKVTRLTFFEAGFYWQGRHEAEVDVAKSTLPGIAGIIIHEACHGYQDRLGGAFAESECATTQYNFLLASNATQIETDSVKRLGSLNPIYVLGSVDVFQKWKSSRPGARGA